MSTAPDMSRVQTEDGLRNAARIDGYVSPDCIPYIAVVGVCDRCGATLTGRKIRWCSKDCQDAYYQNHMWQMARFAAVKRDDRRCVRCGDSRIEVDHIIERRGMPIHQHSCLHHQENLRTLCHECHRTRYVWDVVIRCP